MLGKQKHYVIAQSQVEVNDNELVGHLGIKLAALSKAGLPIPEHFIISTVSFDDFVIASGIVDQVSSHLRRVTTTLPRPELEKIAAEIKEIIRSATIPQTILQPIFQAYQALGNQGDRYVDLLPSWIFEDKLIPQQTTLQAITSVITQTELESELKNCWSLLFTPDSLALRQELGYQAGISIAVIVLASPQAETSGTASAGPTDNIVELYASLGEPSLLQGAEGDVYKYDLSANAAIEKTIINQEQMLIRRARSTVGENKFSEIKISSDWRRQQKIDDTLIAQVAEMTATAAKILNSNVQVFWKFELGNLHLCRFTLLPEIDPIKESNVTSDTTSSQKTTRKAQRINIQQLVQEVSALTSETTNKNLSFPEKPSASSNFAKTISYLNLTPLDSRTITVGKDYAGGYFDATGMVLNYKTLPESLAGDATLLAALVEKYSLDISAAAKAIAPKQLLFTFSNIGIQERQLLSLPISGETGLGRLINFPEAMLSELLAVKRAINLFNLENIQLCLPQCRGLQELEAAKKIASSVQQLPNSLTTNFYLQIAAPAMIFHLGEIDNPALMIDVVQMATNMYATSQPTAEQLHYITALILKTKPESTKIYLHLHTAAEISLFCSQPLTSELKEGKLQIVADEPYSEKDLGIIEKAWQ